MHRLLHQLLASLGKRSGSAEAGVTLIESLVAMVVIAVIVVAITPPIFLVVATRVQNRRAEQAIKIAQGQIDRVRVTVDQGDYDANDLPASIGGTDVQAHAAAGSISNFLFSPTTGCTGAYDPESSGAIPNNQLLKVDVDGDCTEEYLVQVFRNDGTTDLTDPTVPVSFDMGVRVYHTVATDNVGGNLETTQASLKLTSGEGSQRRFPLAVSYTTLVKGEVQFSLDRYRECLNGTCP